MQCYVYFTAIVIFYQVKMLMFYNVQTTTLIFVDKKNKIYNTVMAFRNSK